MFEKVTNGELLKKKSFVAVEIKIFTKVYKITKVE